MRMHTALHLLGVALPYGVTGGNISAQRSRLDFDPASGCPFWLDYAAKLGEAVESTKITEGFLDAAPLSKQTFGERKHNGDFPTW